MSLKIEQAVYYLLKNDIAVFLTAYSRVYPLKLPQTPIYPAITYQPSDLNPTYSMDGYSKLSEAIIIIMIYAKTYEGAATLAGYAKLALEAIKRRVFSSDTIMYFYIDAQNNNVYFATPNLDIITGDSVIVYNANEEGARLGRPLQNNHEYFFIKKPNGAYRFAETYEKALADDPIILLDEGMVAISYAKLAQSLNILGSFLIDENRAFDFDLNVYSIAQTITFHFND